MYEKRTYRELYKSTDLVFFNLAQGETDLSIGVDTGKREGAIPIARGAVFEVREMLEGYIYKYPDFATSLKPLDIKPGDPPVIRRMKEVSFLAGVGPMAAVAGAVAQIVGKRLRTISRQVIVENGGDIFLLTSKTRKIGIFAGKSPLNGKVGLVIRGSRDFMGICTSSGTVGHSISFGKADASVVMAKDVFLADAAATAVGNLVKDEKNINEAMEFAMGIEGVTGVLIILKEHLGALGDVELTGL